MSKPQGLTLTVNIEEAKNLEVETEARYQPESSDSKLESDED